MKKKLILLPVIIFFIIISIFFYLLIIERNPSEIPSALLGKKYPSFESRSLMNDNKFILDNELNEELVLVNFFASWCIPCRKEHVYIKKFSNEKKIKVIGINYKDKFKNAKKWLNEYGNPFSNIAIDKNGRIAIDWGVYGIPETFIIDSNGIIKYRLIGPIDKKIYKKLNSIISQSK